MAEFDPSALSVREGLPPIFEKKLNEAKAAAAITAACRDFDEDMAERRRVERAAAAQARYAGRRNPASKKARARARRSRSQ